MYEINGIDETEIIYIGSVAATVVDVVASLGLREARTGGLGLGMAIPQAVAD